MASMGGSSSLVGRVFVLTGGSSGLGLETARILAQQGATIVLTARNLGSLNEAIDDIGSGNISTQAEMHAMELNLASLSSIREFASHVIRRYPRIDTLICNAGVMVPMEEYRKTSDGFEYNVGVNHLGHFFLVNLLMPLLRASAPSRIVLVSSMLLKEGEIDLNNLNYGLGFRASTSHTPVGYADSKLMNALFGLELQRRLGQEDVAVFCASPGWCRTQLHRHSSIPWYKYPLMLILSGIFMQSASKGCQTIVHCATHPDLPQQQREQGSLFFRKEINLPEIDNMLRSQESIARQLWAQSLELVGLL